MTADELNDSIEALGERIDAIPATVDESRKINSAIADFQDFFWTEYEQWPANELETWKLRIAGLGTEVAALEAKYSGQAITRTGLTDQQKLDAGMAKVEKVSPLGVIAKFPLWFKIAGGGVVAAMAYQFMTSRK